MKTHSFYSSQILLKNLCPIICLLCAAFAPFSTAKATPIYSIELTDNEMQPYKNTGRDCYGYLQGKLNELADALQSSPGVALILPAGNFTINTQLEFNNSSTPPLSQLELNVESSCVAKALKR